MRKAIHIIDSVNEWVGRIVSFFLLIIVFIILYEIFMRQFFHLPTTWAHELSGFLFGGAFLLGVGYTFLHNGHVRVDLFINHLSPRGRAILDSFTHSLMLIYCYVIIRFGWSATLLSFKHMEVSQSAWHPIIFPIRFVVVLGVGLLAFQVLVKYFRDIYFIITRKECR